jgi:PEP-CTERM motif
MSTAQGRSAVWRHAELPLLLFAIIGLLIGILPSRERDLLFPDDGNIAGFLARSAADEQLPTPFANAADDPIPLTGFARVDRTARLLNPVLRSGGASSRGRTRSIGDRALTPATSSALPVLDADSNEPQSIATGPSDAAAPGNGVGSSGGNDRPDQIGQPIQQLGGLISLAVLSPVPEPSTWLFMILGFGMLGQLLRRRKTVSNAKPADPLLS